MTKFKLAIAVFVLNSSLFPNISLAEISSEKMREIISNSATNAAIEIKHKKTNLRNAIIEFKRELDKASDEMEGHKKDSNLYFKLSVASFATFLGAVTYLKYVNPSVSVLGQFVLTASSGPITITGLAVVGTVHYYKLTIAKDKVESLQKQLNDLNDQLDLL